jgi:hypothetical protein
LALLDRHRRAKADIALAATLDPRREELRQRLDKLTAIAKHFHVLLASGTGDDNSAIVAPVALPTASIFGNAIEAVRQRLADDPFKVTAGKEYKAALKAVDALTERLRVHTTDGWRAWVDRETTRIDEAELSRYAQLKDWAATVATVRERRRQVAGLPDSLPETADDLEVARWAMEQLRAEIGKLPRSDDPEVRRFLDAAGRAGGADLNLLTEKVLIWLKDNNMYGQCRVVIR